MAKKYGRPLRRQKVKRYRRSFYSRGARLHGVILIALLAAVVLAVAWFAAPRMIDWASHTWYTVVRGRDLTSSSVASSASSSAAASSASSSEAAAGSAQAASEAASEADGAVLALPQTGGTAVVEGSWAEADITALTSEEGIRAAAQQFAAQGFVYVLIPLKDSGGSIYYASAVPAAAKSLADIQADPALIASVFKEYGLVPVAQLTAFRDPIAAYTDRSLAIQYNSNGENDYLWLDAANAAAGGKAWLNPYSAGAVEFIGDLIAEMHQAGFEQVALRCVQFPAAVSSKQDFGSTGGVSRSAQLAADIAVWQNRFEGAVTLWYRYTLSECTAVSSELGAPAVELGMRNLLVEGSAVPGSETYTALEQAAAAAGVEHVMYLEG